VIPNLDNQKVKVNVVACPTTFESKNTDKDVIQSLSKPGCTGSNEFAV